MARDAENALIDLLAACAPLLAAAEVAHDMGGVIPPEDIWLWKANTSKGQQPGISLGMLQNLREVVAKIEEKD